jgi:hypothetical protein
VSDDRLPQVAVAYQTRAFCADFFGKHVTRPAVRTQDAPSELLCSTFKAKGRLAMVVIAAEQIGSEERCLAGVVAQFPDFALLALDQGTVAFGIRGD